MIEKKGKMGTWLKKSNLKNVDYGRLLTQKTFQCQNHRHPEGVEKERGLEEIFEQVVAENFPNLMKETNIHVQEAQRTLPSLMRTDQHHDIE